MQSSPPLPWVEDACQIATGRYGNVWPTVASGDNYRKCQRCVLVIDTLLVQQRAGRLVAVQRQMQGRPYTCRMGHLWTCQSQLRGIWHALQQTARVTVGCKSTVRCSSSDISSSVASECSGPARIQWPLSRPTSGY